MLWAIMSIIVYGSLYVGVPVLACYVTKRGITK